MAKSFSKKFYSSLAWQLCRDAYAKSQSGLCERCMERGLYEPGEIVHHKIVLSPENVNDVDIALSWDNLELVCRKCHAEEHGKKRKRYDLDDDGMVIRMR